MIYALVALFALAASAQTFEVASIRPDRRPMPPANTSSPLPPPPPPPSVRQSPAGLSILGASLKYSLQWAYGMRSWQISGPDWLDDQRYDIVARTAVPTDVATLRLMLRALLTERFRIKLRVEKKDARVMGIVVAPGGARLQASAEGTPFSNNVQMLGRGAFRWTYKNAAISMLEGPLSTPNGDPVLDLTSLAGTFDFTFERPGRDPDNPESFSADLQAALQKQLGLRLEPRRAPVEMLVIERADKVPVEN